MYARAAALAVLVGYATARFGQEQGDGAIQAIAEVQGGAGGAASTISGAAISDLLGAANACDKLQRGDQILAELGNGQDAVNAAIGIVAAEKNFNSFTASNPTICSDPALPSSAALRGILPLIDPAVGGADVANKLAAQTKTAPLQNTDGQSVADLLTANGFTNFTAQADDGPLTTGNVGGAAASASGSANKTVSARAASNSTSAGTAGSAAQTSSIQGLDFGTCVPTIKFEGGLGGRPATEFTFQMIDPVAAEGQQEALNPNIITNRLCDQLKNVCNANDAAQTACADAKTAIKDLGTKDKSTADAWNTQLGFAGTVTNPDGGAEQPAASKAAVKPRASAFFA